ncbi:MAG: protein kinase domain-containing protein, partial [Planctomycetota bacterium]
MTFAQPFKDYEILDRIGSGAMGTVFKARHKSLSRTVALKVLRPSLARDERYVNRLRREARIVAAFNHPNIVAGYDLGQEGGYHFFVMEFVEGK